MKYRYFEIGKRTRMIETVQPLTVEELQKYVQGPFEFMALKNGTTACVNEEGMIMKLPYNPAIKQEDTDIDITYGIRGNVIIGRVDIFGEFVGVEPEITEAEKLEAVHQSELNEVSERYQK